MKNVIVEISVEEDKFWNFTHFDHASIEEISIALGQLNLAEVMLIKQLAVLTEKARVEERE